MQMLIALQKEKEDLDDISNELELADEDEKIPFADYCPLDPDLTDRQQIQNRRLFYQSSSARGARTLKHINKQDRGGRWRTGGQAQHDQGGNVATQGRIVCEIWEKYQLRDIGAREMIPMNTHSAAEIRPSSPKPPMLCEEWGNFLRVHAHTIRVENI